MTTKAKSLLKASRDTVGILTLRVLWAGLGFFSTVLIARMFGASWVGTYFLAIAIVTAAATLAQLGMDLPLMRMIAVSNDRSDYARVRSLLRKAATIAAAIASVFTVVIIILSGLTSGFFNDDSLPTMLRIVALAVVPYTIVMLFARGFMSTRRPAMAELVHRIGFQVGFIGLILLLGSDTGWALGIAFAVTYWILYFFGLWQWRSSLRSASRSAPIEGRDLLRPGLPILLAASIQLVIDWSDTVMIGYFMAPESVGIYGTALRLGTAMTLILGAATSVFGPRYASLYEEGRTYDLSNLVRWVSVGCALLSLPLLIAFAFFAEPLMGIFGVEFSSGANALRILAFGQFAHVGTGLVGLLLAMTGHEKRLLQATMFSATINVILNLLLIPRMGIEGAALATAAALVLTNTLNIYLVRRELGIIAVGLPKQVAL